MSLSAVFHISVSISMRAVSQDSELQFQFGAEDEYEVIMIFESP